MSDRDRDRSNGTAGVAPAASISVWDPFVRIFHWSLVIFFAVAFVSAEEFDGVHEWAGYVVAALVVGRLLWGFIGTRHARFSDFVRGPSETLRYLGDILRGRERRYMGHNPAGAWMILALLAGMLSLGATGYLLSIGGPLGSEFVEEVHEAIANAMLVLVVFHIAGVAISSFRHGENLAKAMITGRKPSQ